MIRKTYRSSDAIFREAIRDFTLTIERWRLPILLAWREIRNQYRRSILGPFWLTLTVAIRIAALGLIFGTLFKQPIALYLPWLTAGIVSWELISGSIQSSCSWFTGRSGYIKQGQTTIGTLVLLGMCLSLITFLHALPICFLATFLVDSPMNANLLYLPIGLVMQLLVLLPLGLILATIVPRFRDIDPLVGSFLQVAFFLTPIVWLPEDRGITQLVGKWNPLSYIVDWVRKPILGEPLTALDLLVFSLLFAFLAPVAVFVFVRYRPRLAYWL